MALVATLTGCALIWAVAQAEGVPVSLNSTLFSDGNPLERDPFMAKHYPDRWTVYRTDEDTDWEEAGDAHFCTYSRPVYNPTTDWSQGGPIIEREKIEIKYLGYDNPPYWGALKFSPSTYARRGAVGPTPLIAAMRCYVASKLGDEIEIPEELQPTATTVAERQP